MSHHRDNITKRNRRIESRRQRKADIAALAAAKPWQTIFDATTGTGALPPNLANIPTAPTSITLTSPPTGKFRANWIFGRCTRCHHKKRIFALHGNSPLRHKFPHLCGACYHTVAAKY